MPEKKSSALDYIPDKMNIPSLRAAAMNCHGCHLYRNAKQTVFGSGSNHAQNNAASGLR